MKPKKKRREYNPTKHNLYVLHLKVQYCCLYSISINIIFHMPLFVENEKKKAKLNNGRTNESVEDRLSQKENNKKFHANTLTDKPIVYLNKCNGRIRHLHSFVDRRLLVLNNAHCCCCRRRCRCCCCCCIILNFILFWNNCILMGIPLCIPHR